MRFKVIAFLIFILLALHLTYAQKPDPASIIEDIIKAAEEQDLEEEDLTELVAALEQLLISPLNINTATREEWSIFPFLNPLQIQDILNYKAQYGEFIDVLELQAINSLSPEDVMKLLPFVKIGKDPGSVRFSFRQIKKNLNANFLLRYGRILEKQLGYSNKIGNHYLGSPDKLLLKLSIENPDLMRFNLSMKKDAGEYFFKGKNSYPLDFLSLSLSLKKIGAITELILGDYHLNFGQGLSLWTSFSFSKSTEITQNLKSVGGISPSRSSNEFFFYRGVALALKLNKNLQLYSFYSNRNLDAAQKTDSILGLVQSNLNTSGYHRTMSEMDYKNSLNMQLIGLAIQYQYKNIQLGLLNNYRLFNHPFVPLNALYAQDNFRGKDLTQSSLFYSFSWRNLYLYGELAYEWKADMAQVHGLLVNLSPSLSMNLSYRNYAKGFHAYINSAYSSSSNSPYQKGFFTALNYDLSPRIKFSFYIDEYSYQGFRYNADAASKGMDLVAQIRYSPDKKQRYSLRYKYRYQEQNTDSLVYFRFLVPALRYEYQVIAQGYELLGLKFKHQLILLQSKIADLNAQRAYLIHQELEKKIFKQRLICNLSFSYFSIPNYQSRIYLPEKDVLYSFNYSMYYGKGFKAIINFKLKLLDRIELWARYTYSKFFGQDRIGTYLDEIQGNSKSDVKFQLRYKF